jgi:nitrogen fixation/metabolism regulation signal transduction histidine kinase
MNDASRTETNKSITASDGHRVRTIFALLVAATIGGFVTVAFLFAAYSNMSDKPTHPFFVALSITLGLIPSLIAAQSYLRARKRGMAGATLVRSVALRVSVVAVLLLLVLAVLSPPP